MDRTKVGIIRETKNPPDKRVALSPKEAKIVTEQYPNIELFIQSSEFRCFPDSEYLELGLKVVDDISDCEILIGIKEVAKSQLIPNKKYLFFSHTAKEQPFNKALLQKMLELNIQMIDYEYMTNELGVRQVAFGRWAGLAGAYNALMTYGKKSHRFDLRRAYTFDTYDEFHEEIKKIDLDPIKILITGGGRVAHGAMEVLDRVKGIEKVSSQQFLSKTFDHPVYCQIDPWDYLERKDGIPFDFKYFMKHPAQHNSTFKPYTKAADMFIACHFWNEKSPVFMTKEDMQEHDFTMKLIADISCDVGGPIPSTLRPATIAEPTYGYDPFQNREVGSFDQGAITVMAVDNLPGELPRNSSEQFGKRLIEKIFPSLFGVDEKGIIFRASITTTEGQLNAPFKYLEDYVNNK